VIEASGDGEGGGGEDDGVVVVEERGGEEFGYVDGCGLQVGVEGGVSCAAGQVRTPPAARRSIQRRCCGRGIREEGEVGADVGGAFTQAGGLFDVLQVVEFAFESSERVEDAVCSSRRSLRGRPRGCGKGMRPGPAGNPADSVGRIAKNMRERSLRMAQALSIADVLASLPSASGRRRGEFVDALVAEADAEVVGGDLFELVGLVEDDGGGFGQDAGVGGVAACCLMPRSAKKR